MFYHFQFTAQIHQKRSSKIGVRHLFRPYKFLDNSFTYCTKCIKTAVDIMTTLGAKSRGFSDNTAMSWLKYAVDCGFIRKTISVDYRLDLMGTVLFN
jgi:hypothetical protein